MTFQGTPYTEKPEALRTKKTCPVCQTEFTPRSGVHKYCTETCKGKAKYLFGQVSTESQYASISGNWYRYFQRLLQKGRKELTVQMLLDLLTKQKGLCALSGVPLTCTLEKGKRFKTNASIDRIQAGEEYSLENIQLVCSAVNSWRADTDLDEFLWFCKQITQFQERGENSYAIHEKRS